MKKQKILITALALGLGWQEMALAAENETATMEEVVVTATRTEKAVDAVPASVTVITREEMERQHIQTIDQALQHEAGVYVKRSKGIADSMARVQMRGLYGQDRTLVLVNSMPVNGGYSGGVAWNQLSIDNVERIEVIRGPASALYGGNAMGGVINIITREPDKLSASARLGYGSRDTASYGASVSGRPTERLGLRLGIEGDKTGGYATTPVTRSISSGAGTLTGGYLTTSTSGSEKWVVGDKGDNEAARWNLNLATVYELTDTGKLSFDLQYGHQEYEYGPPHTYLTDASGNPSFSGTVDVGDGLVATISPNNYIYYTGLGDEDFTILGLTWQESFGDLGVTAKLGHQLRDKWYTINKASSGQTYWDAPGSKTDSNTATWLADLQADLDLGDSHLLTFGTSLRTDDFEQAGYDLSYYRDENSVTAKTEITEGKDRFYGLFVQDEYQMTDTVTLYGGLRFDYWQAMDGRSGSIGSEQDFSEPSDSAISPRVGAVWQVLPDTSLRATIGRAFRPPSIYELYRTWVSGSRTYHSNPNLGPETVWSYEAGVDQHFLERRLTLGATVFHSKLKDAIESYWVGSDNYKENLAEATISGIELSGSYSPISWLNLRANFTYNDTEVKENPRDPDTVGKHLTNTPETTANLGADITYSQLTASLNGNWVGRIYTRDLNDDQDDVYGGYSKRWLWDAKLSITPREWIELSMSVENLLDEEYYDYYVGQPRTWYLEATFSY
jgi:iron complex outermembrane receptor protein